MFTQAAYSSASVMLNELIAYIRSMGKNNAWEQDYIDDVVNLANIAYEDSYSIFSYDTTIIREMLAKFQYEYEQFTILYTRDNVDSIPKYAKFMNVIGALQDTTKVVLETTSTANILQDQFEEGAKDLQKTSDDAWKKVIPFVAIGVGAYFILPRIIEEMGKK